MWRNHFDQKTTDKIHKLLEKGIRHGDQVVVCRKFNYSPQLVRDVKNGNILNHKVLYELIRIAKNNIKEDKALKKLLDRV